MRRCNADVPSPKFWEKAEIDGEFGETTGGYINVTSQSAVLNPTTSMSNQSNGSRAMLLAVMTRTPISGWFDMVNDILKATDRRQANPRHVLHKVAKRDSTVGFAVDDLLDLNTYNAIQGDV